MMSGAAFIVRGQVQGVGFRPTVWRIANELGLTGNVRNVADGVEICVWGDAIDQFAERLTDESPELAKIDAVERSDLTGPAPGMFKIASSCAIGCAGQIMPDSIICDACLTEVRDPFANRFRYPFANCTNCGPRFSIITGIPYDRCNTTMAEYTLCPVCLAEYQDPNDRRFHAQPIACHACGPRASLERIGDGTVNHEAFSMLDDVDAVGGMLLKGHIVAIKSLGGFHLACDATNSETVALLRARKRRPSKALALMARDTDVIQRYAHVSDHEIEALESPQNPIVLLKMRGEPLPDSIAPALDRVGFMLPSTPMHHLMLRRVDRPVVMTSGNISGSPQCTTNDEAREQLLGVAEFALVHDRTIANRIDDSVVRVDLGRRRVLRRARGYAPSPIALPPGLRGGGQVLAMGGELKNTFCITNGDKAIVSQHMGDLENVATADDVSKNLKLYQDLFDHNPQVIAVDDHPDYRSTKDGKEIARSADLPVIRVQHHHAHVASCLVENGWSEDQGRVLGIAMDGLGLGPDGTIWGGEFIACDYRSYQRVGCLKPVALPGGESAVREPWRNAYSHLVAEIGWTDFAMNYSDLDLYRKLSTVQRATVDAMIANGMNTPLASSCGRLFDAAAAMTGLAWDRQDHEGQAAMAFEAALDADGLNEDDELIYPFNIPQHSQLKIPYIEPLWAWRALLGDLLLNTPVGTISARFHRGLANAITHMAVRLSKEQQLKTVVLTGGCFQNATLFELVHRGIESCGIDVLSHSEIPTNDGGLSLGQAAIAIATNEEGDPHVPRDSRADC